jgi:hypothetical protein
MRATQLGIPILFVSAVLVRSHARPDQPPNTLLILPHGSRQGSREWTPSDFHESLKNRIRDFHLNSVVERMAIPLDFIGFNLIASPIATGN